MNTFRRMCIFIIAVLLAAFFGVNIYINRHIDEAEGEYRVEAKRIAEEIEEKGEADLSNYHHITGVFREDGDELYHTNNPYLIIEASGELYRVEYKSAHDNGWIKKTINGIFLTLAVLLALLMYYLWKHIVLPFGRINKVPQELAKGNLAVPIPEEKSRFFGRFTWGINLLRENIEEGRKRELSVQRDKKLLLLSLSHDIKTPLSAIKLNAQALSRGLYRDEAKRREAAESINKRADEIETLMGQITHAASEDFMEFNVVQGEEFLSRIIERISARYSVQLADAGTEFVIGEYSDRLLACDADRLAECIQNLIENAMKYGDGCRISIDFDIVDGCELITVSNTGCTLEATELTQIFESFHRGSNSDKIQGSGLGLYICRKLMGLMGGDVYASVKDGCFSAVLVVKLA